MNDMQEEQTLAPENLDAQKVAKDSKTDVSLGKFKDVNALLNAYNSLQSEFTKRCQRIKELEGATDKDKCETKEETSSKVSAPETVGSVEKEEKVMVEKDEYLKEYLKNLLGSKQKAVIMGGDGTSVKTPVEKPKTIAEAGALAKEIL